MAKLVIGKKTARSTVKRPGIHSKNKQSKNKNSKNYFKGNVGQGK